MNLFAASASTAPSLKKKLPDSPMPSPGIFARNCRACRIDKPTASEFIAAHHRMGDTGSRYQYGLFVSRSTGAAEAQYPEGTLVAVAEFSNARRWTKGGRIISSYQWIRYASLSGVRVIGGMGKLLQAFIDDVSPDDVMTYSDCACQNGGEAYLRLGFVQECTVDGNGWRDVKYRLKLTPW